MINLWLNPSAGSKANEKTIKYDDSKKVKDYDSNSLYKLYGGGSGSGGGGGYNVAKADISDLLSSYEQQAESARQAAETKYSNTRSDLLTSLKRFQDQSAEALNRYREQNALELERYRNENAENVKNQKQGFLSTQSNLEMARELANRQTRISNAARGLGGSGLQQLAQLQNLLGQSEEISKVAGENQSAMDKLATLLREYEADSSRQLRQYEDDSARQLREYQEDYDTKLRQSEEERANTLSSIASALANQRATAIANNEQNYVNALNQAAAQAAAARASASSNNAAARQAANAASGALALWQKNLNSELKDLSGMSKKELKAYTKKNYGKENATDDLNKAKALIRNNYLYQLSSTDSNALGLQAQYGLDARTVNTALNNMDALLNGLSYYTPQTTTKKTTKTANYYSPVTGLGIL